MGEDKIDFTKEATSGRGDHLTGKEYQHVYAFVRAMALCACVSLASAGVALAAQVDVKSGAQGLTKIALANGQNIYGRKPSGKQQLWQVFVLGRDGKYVPAPPGSYKQKGGNVIVVGDAGTVSLPIHIINYQYGGEF
jgi:hypothetical protein